MRQPSSDHEMSVYLFYSYCSPHIEDFRVDAQKRHPKHRPKVKKKKKERKKKKKIKIKKEKKAKGYVKEAAKTK
ncbi:MAG: hypothetical protein AB2693_32705 [Candidatus Thiodiazotropha sp.]